MTHECEFTHMKNRGLGSGCEPGLGMGLGFNRRALCASQIRQSNSESLVQPVRRPLEILISLINNRITMEHTEQVNT